MSALEIFLLVNLAVNSHIIEEDLKEKFIPAFTIC